MKLILITGRIGSGKSTVADYLKNKGYTIIKTDDYAKQLYKDNWELKFHVLKLFGIESVTTSNEVDLRFLENRIFKPEYAEFKEKLELCIFHTIKDNLPQIIVDETFGSNKGMIFIEAPETKLVINKAKSLPCYSHKIVVRISDNKERFNRIFERNPEKTFFDIKERDNAQIDAELEEGDILINNDSRDKDNLINQINELVLNEKHQ